MEDDQSSPPAMPEADLLYDLRYGRVASVETLEGRFITGMVHRVWQRLDSTPLALVVGDATIPWEAIRAIRDHVVPQTFVPVAPPIPNPMPPILPGSPQQGLTTTPGNE